MELTSTTGLGHCIAQQLGEILAEDLLTLLDTNHQTFPGDCSVITHWHTEFKHTDTDGTASQEVWDENMLNALGQYLDDMLINIAKAWTDLSNNGKYYVSAHQDDPFVDLYFKGKEESHDDTYYKLQVYAWDFSLSFILTKVAL